MSNVPAELRYAKSHEWLKLDRDGTALVGITDYAQGALGDITYVQMPKVGDTLAAGAAMGVIESVKAASDIYAPVSGTVLAVNADLDATPERVNQEPYTGGWLIRVKLAKAAEADALMDAAGYTQNIA
jgi:glycine cleavage system H protein